MMEEMMVSFLPQMLLQQYSSTFFHMYPQQALAASWDGENKEKQMHLEARIPESGPKATFWSYSGCKLLRHQRLAWCYRQDCCQCDQKKNTWKPHKSSSIKSDFSTAVAAQEREWVLWREVKCCVWCWETVRSVPNTSLTDLFITVSI